MFIPEATNKDYEPAPAGTHKAICNRVVDMGTQEVEFAGDKKTVRQILLGFEIEGLQTKKGSSFAISKTMTFSSHEKATFRKYAEALMGRAFADKDLRGKKRLDAAELLGRGCLLSIAHIQMSDKISARVDGVLALPAGTKPGRPVNEPEILSLEEGAFDPAVYDKQPWWIKDKVAKSPEYRELLTPKTKRPTAEIIDDGLPEAWA